MQQKTTNMGQFKMVFKCIFSCLFTGISFQLYAQNAQKDTLLLMEYDSISSAFYDQNNMEEGTKYLYKVVEIAERNEWHDVWTEYTLITRQAESFTGNYGKAMDILQRLEAKEKSGVIKNPILRQSVYQHFSIFLLEIGDYEGCQKKLIEYQNLLDRLGKGAKEISVTAQLAIKTGQYAKAIRLAQEDLKEHQLREGNYPGPKGHYPFKMVILQKNLGQAYLADGQLTEAKKWLDIANEGFPKLVPEFSPFALKQSIFDFLSQLAVKEGDFVLARGYQEKRIEALNADMSINLMQRTIAFEDMSRIEMKLGNMQSASEFLDQAEKELKEHDHNILDFPGLIAARVALLRSEGKLKEGLELFAQYSAHLKILPEDPKMHAKLLLEVAITAQMHPDQNASAAWMRFYGFLEDISASLGVSILPAFEELILLANSYSMEYLASKFQKKNDPEDWITSLKIIEFNLAFEANFELITKGNDLDFGIDPQVLEREKAIRSAIFLNQVTQKKNPSADTEATLGTLYKRQDSLKNVILSQYPEYYRLRYSFGRKDLHELLNAKEDFITYFYDERQLYRIGKMGKKHFIDPIPIQNFEETLVSFSKSLSYPDNTQKHLEIGAKLYQILLGHLHDGSGDFFIVPYGKIQIIPFQALNTSPQGDYLIASHRVTYQPSLSKLLSKTDRDFSFSTPNIQFFAPFYTEVSNDISRGSQARLPGTKEEMQRISRSFAITPFIGKQAEKSNFILASKSSSFVHLATHAFYPGDTEDSPWIVFDADDAKQNLYSYEIYNLHLPLDFLGLSACKTGLGEFVAGEGVQSLGNAFSFSGVKSLIISLWGVNDLSTAELMDYFYEELAEGRPKDEALQLAQLHYLDVNSGLKQHPYYWAGFVLQGENTPVTQSKLWLYILIGGLLVGLILFSVWKYKNRMYAS